ncbi:MgtC/SapB family protein [Lutispora thermophila]|uniref:Putative Mg2+ transporter-C (MgtC) family protein n=1 Tax=Lutispora thermophila DSM 19022 TaxID=1122184 RepID=A0A1M6DA17_9FIRM|nr:MgtC/SapB family protein [Lutispora thermophila]SHI70064.1 putative Mg2+ transporter-C (MgtC) family protein [Lutispora thermophila DSM 19022]
MTGLLDVLLRLGTAAVLAGLVGLERETSNRPAGFRTHILVSVASSLVMIGNLYAFELLKYQANMDPMRLGAQVISGIGFLGAGTILKEGATIRGLTTAASLWSVACIGLVCGLGFYSGAICATIFVLLSLITLNKIEVVINKKRQYLHLIIKSVDKPGQLGKIGIELGKLNVAIKNISIEPIDEYNVIIKLVLKGTKDLKPEDIIKAITSIDGISMIEI